MTYQQIAQTGVENSIYHKNNEVLNQNLTQIEQLMAGTLPQLGVGQWVDAKDTEGDWLEAQVTETRPGEVKIHYNEWTSNWDEWLPLGSNRLAVFRSHTVQHPKAAFQSPCPVLLAREQMDARSVEELLQRYCNFGAHLVLASRRMNESVESYLESLRRGREEVKETHKEEERKESVRPKTPAVRKLCADLAPLTDRLGRFVTDLAPYFAAEAYDNVSTAINNAVEFPRVPERREGDPVPPTGIMPNQSQIYTFGQFRRRHVPGTAVQHRGGEMPRSNPNAEAGRS